MLSTFRATLESNLDEFRKNVLTDLARLEEILERDLPQGILPSSGPNSRNSKEYPRTLGSPSPRNSKEKGEEDEKEQPKQKEWKRKKNNNKPVKKVTEDCRVSEPVETIPPSREESQAADPSREESRCLDSPDTARLLDSPVTADTAAEYPGPIGKASMAAVARSSLATSVFTDPTVVASCPESFHDEVATICMTNNFAKAFGQKGDMLDTLSGEEWVGKWEAKVVIAAVTKARTMKANHVKIICIQGGKHCDKEVAAQPRLKRAIVQEFGENLRVGLEWLEMEEFRERYVLKPAGASDSIKIYVCHKQSNSVDAVMRLKLQLEQRLPKVTFYNVGYERETQDKYEVEVKSCTHFLIFLTKGALVQRHVISQIQYALQKKKQIVLVMETDKAYGGVSLSEETFVLGDDIREVFTKTMMIPWSREPSVQEVSLDKIVASIAVGFEEKRLLRVHTGPISDDASKREVFHPSFHLFCNCAGIALPGAWRTTYFLGYVNLITAVLTVAFGIAVAFYPLTEDFRDRRDLLANPMVLLGISWGSQVARKVFELPEFVYLLALHANDVHLNRRVHRISKQLTRVGIITCVMITAFVGAQAVQFMRNADYIAEPSALRIVFATFFTLSLVPCIMQGTCLIVLSHCCYFMTLMSFASAFSQLHPQVRDFGIQQSVEQGMIIHVTESDFVRFQKSFIDIWTKTRVGLRTLSAALIVADVCWIVNFVLHGITVLDLARNGRSEGAVEGLDSDGWHLTVRPMLVFVADLVVLGPFFYMHLFHRALSQWVARLIFTKSSTRVAVGNFVNELRVDFPLLPLTNEIRLDSSMTPYVVLFVSVRWVMFAYEFYIVDY